MAGIDALEGVLGMWSRDRGLDARPAPPRMVQEAEQEWGRPFPPSLRAVYSRYGSVPPVLADGAILAGLPHARARHERSPARWWVANCDTGKLMLRPDGVLVRRRGAEEQVRAVSVDAWMQELWGRLLRREDRLDRSAGFQRVRTRAEEDVFLAEAVAFAMGWAPFRGREIVDRAAGAARAELADRGRVALPIGILDRARGFAPSPIAAAALAGEFDGEDLSAMLSMGHGPYALFAGVFDVFTEEMRGLRTVSWPGVCRWRPRLRAGELVVDVEWLG